MVGEGHAFDMIRRIKEGREASRLRRERANDKLKHLNRANEPYPLPKRKRKTAIILFGERLLSWES